MINATTMINIGSYQETSSALSGEQEGNNFMTHGAIASSEIAMQSIMAATTGFTKSKG